MSENIPRSITQFYSYSMSNNLNIRMVRKASFKIQHKSNIATKSLLYRSIFLYNKLPYDLRTFNTKKLSRHLQNSIGDYFPNNSIPNNDHG